MKNLKNILSIILFLFVLAVIGYFVYCFKAM